MHRHTRVVWWWCNVTPSSVHPIIAMLSLMEPGSLHDSLIFRLICDVRRLGPLLFRSQGDFILRLVIGRLDLPTRHVVANTHVHWRIIQVSLAERYRPSTAFKTLLRPHLQYAKDPWDLHLPRLSWSEEKIGNRKACLQIAHHPEPCSTDSLAQERVRLLHRIPHRDPNVKVRTLSR